MKLLVLLLITLPSFAQYPQTQSLPDEYLLGQDVDTTAWKYEGTIALSRNEYIQWLKPWFIFERESNVTVYGKDTVHTDMTPYSVAVILDLLRLWQEYKEECGLRRVRHDRLDDPAYTPAIELRPDSIKGVYFMPDSTRVWRTDNKGEFTDWGAPKFVPRYYWTHRKPTLPGFFDFLERRLRK